MECPRGRSKMEKRAVSWAAFAKRRRLLTLGALPRDMMPKSQREATGYFLFLHKVRLSFIPPWEVP
jgi:hypothetical protein